MKTEICTICKRKIEIENEHYLILDEFKGRKPLCKTYYHKNCFADKMLVQRQMKDALGKLGGIINGAKEKMGIEEKQEFIINS